jgi:predicted dehydrogenase
MERIPTCVVGCGGMGQRHILGFEALLGSGISTLDLVAVCDVREDNARRAAAEVERITGRRPRTHLSIDDAVADPDIAAFDVVTDASTHHAVALPILDGGKHLICEKPLGLTVRACQAMMAAAERSGVVLATAENLRRDPPNRLAKAVLDAGLLGHLHVMVHNSIGGSDYIMITPWRHMKDKGAIGLDMAVHYTDIIQFYLGEFDVVFGRGLIAEPVRRRRERPELELESYRARFAEIPESVEATGEDSVIALYRMKSGVTATLTYVPSGPGHSYFQRSLHGRQGSLEVPRDRQGNEVELRRSDGVLRGRELLDELPDFQLDEITSRLFGDRGVTYEWPFARVDAAHLAIELHDFGEAILQGRSPEVDGNLGTTAVAAVLAAYESDLLGRSVTMEEVMSSSVSGYQDEIDEGLGLPHG